MTQPASQARTTTTLRYRPARFALGACTLLLAARAAGAPALEHASEYRVLTSNFPPYTAEHGDDAPGPLVKLALEMLRRAGRHGEPSFLPWPRAQLLLASEDGASSANLILPLVRSSEREAAYQWIAKLHCRNSGFIALREHMARFDEAQLARSRVAMLRTSPVAPQVRSLAFKSLVQANSFDDMARLLGLGSVDALYGSHESLLLALQERGFERSKLAVSTTLDTTEMWLAGPRNMPAAEVEELRRVYAEMQQAGVVKQLLDKSGLSLSGCPLR